MKKLIITLSLVFILAASGLAQSNLFGIGWEINIPSNNNYVKKTSYAGGRMEYRHFFNKKFSDGVALNWATYEQFLPRQTFTIFYCNKAVTSDFVAQIYQLPITATAHYYFIETDLFKPYIGLAVGGQYLEQSLYYNVYVSDDNGWGFVARPELGTIIKTSVLNKWGFLAAVNYSYSTNKTEIINSDSFKNIGFTIGVAFWQ